MIGVLGSQSVELAIRTPIEDRQAAGSHEVWFNPETKKYTTVLNHPGDLPQGTIMSCKRGAGAGTLQ